MENIPRSARDFGHWKAGQPSQAERIICATVNAAFDYTSVEKANVPSFPSAMSFDPP